MFFIPFGTLNYSSCGTCQERKGVGEKKVWIKPPGAYDLTLRYNSSLTLSPDWLDSCGHSHFPFCTKFLIQRLRLHRSTVRSTKFSNPFQLQVVHLERNSVGKESIKWHNSLLFILFEPSSLFESFNNLNESPTSELKIENIVIILTRPAKRSLF